MNADSIEIVEDARVEKGLEKFPGKTRTGRADDGGGAIGLADGFGSGKRQRGVLLRVRFRTPELDIGFIPNLPNDVASFEMSGGGRSPTGVGGNAFGVLRRGGGFVGCAGERMGAAHFFFVKRMDELLALVLTELPDSLKPGFIPPPPVITGPGPTTQA